MTRCSAFPRQDGPVVVIGVAADKDAAAMIDAIAPEKDVEGVNPANLGLILEGTVPAGVLTILALALFEALERGLKTGDGLVDHVPLARLGAHHHEHQVGAGSEVPPVVPDDEGLEAPLRLFARGDEHLDDVVVDRVHLGVNLEAEDPVAA